MAKRKINAKEFVKDVRDGAHRNALMVKYELSPRQLDSLYEKLRQKGILPKEEVAEAPVAHTEASLTTQAPVGECPSCGLTMNAPATQCPRCGGSLTAKQPPPVATMEPGQPGYAAGYGTPQTTGMTTGSDDYDDEVPDWDWESLQPYAYGAAGYAVLLLLASIFGFGPHVLIIGLVCLGIYSFVYNIVILYHAFTTNILWGFLVLCFGPGSIIFVLVHYNLLYRGKIAPKLWFASLLLLPAMAFFLALSGPGR
ncbi:hypothetical protein ACFL2Q_10010 [Thermodesulfobacteriota bacterium]